MEGSIRLSVLERKTVLSAYRGGEDERVARRAHVLLLLDGDWSYREIMDALFCSSDLVATVKRRFLAGGVQAVLTEPDVESVIAYWKLAVVGWVQHSTPRDFGFFRSRWSCELLARVLEEQLGLNSVAKRSVARCTSSGSPGAVPVQSWAWPIPNTTRNWAESSDCWRRCLRMKSRFSRTRSTCI